MADLVIPNQIANGNPNDGDEVAANFDAVVDNVNLRVHSDGSVAMSAPLVLAANVDGDGGLVAATKDYVNERAGVAAGVALAKRGTVLGLSAGQTSRVGFVSTGNPSFAVGTTIVSPRIATTFGDELGGPPERFATYDVTPNSFRFFIQVDGPQTRDIFLDWVVIGEVA